MYQVTPAGTQISFPELPVVLRADHGCTSLSTVDPDLQASTTRSVGTVVVLQTHSPMLYTSSSLVCRQHAMSKTSGFVEHAHAPLGGGVSRDLIGFWSHGLIGFGLHGSSHSRVATPSSRASRWIGAQRPFGKTKCMTTLCGYLYLLASSDDL